MRKCNVEIISGVEGLCLVINDTRVCGPKPWGGGKVVQRWTVDFDNLIEQIKQTMPDESLTLN